MKLMVQPEDGIEPILDALRKAKKSIQILIFRFDRSEIERALVEAVERGVSVQALIAFTNRGEEKNLRKLEMRLLEKGITVTRTADDLVRYHGKMFIIDRKELYLLAFNYTHLDITLSRSFAVAITTPSVVAEAIKLFECDVHRKQYVSTSKKLVVSPVNARKELMDFLGGAKKQILMYEMKISDPDFIALLRDKVSQGIEVRVIGRVSPKAYSLPLRLLPTRLHTRLIIRDGKSAFLGSQSLRKLELEARREIGVIFENAPAIHKMMHVFEQDWGRSQAMQDVAQPSLELPVRRVAKIVAKHIHVKPVVEEVLERVLDRSNSDVPFEPDEVAQTVRDAFREEVHDAVLLALRDMAQQAALVQTEKESKVP
ncbi:phospholipase D-like domain-containing protein [Terriglobus roseus]|uniref:phospholipase D n=1 Tax=Terriglobus roseus TaxID=392734 RepID=A0A1G7FS97_9BACT|nr:phospholipase D-like domain-containing protein [Terriglobus roseus]SDE78787.1 Phosphatidylserine/phosphatidylglycerophosphate/cardiolipin synthase [Terriglobus roseus]